MFSKYDICRPVCRQDIIKIIKDIIKVSSDNVEFTKVVYYHIKELKSKIVPDDKLIKLLEWGYGETISDLITQLCAMIAELRYRSAGKPYQIFKSLSTIPPDIDSLPSGCFQFGNPFSFTEKIDGTQIQIGVKRYNSELGIEGNPFYMQSHSGGSIIGKNLITLKDLEPCARPGHTSVKDHTFQGGNLTKNFIPLIPNLWKLMDKYCLEEAWFYFELTFNIKKEGNQTPKGVPYDDTMMDSCYLFGMTYNKYDEHNIPIEVIKVSVNPDTKPIFDEYNIPTVNILYAGDSFSLDDFEHIMKMVHENNRIEGGVFIQPGSCLKILTHYYTENVDKYQIQERHSEFMKMQDIYHYYLNMRNKPRIEKKKHAIDMSLVDEEFKKELGHHNWKDMFTEFYQIPGNDSNKIFNFLIKSKLINNIFKSLAEVDEFNDMTNKQKGIIIKHIKNQMIKNKKDIREQFNIPSSKTS